MKITPENQAIKDGKPKAINFQLKHFENFMSSEWLQNGHFMATSLKLINFLQLIFFLLSSDQALL